MLEGEEQVEDNKQEVLLPRGPKKVEIVVEEPEEPAGEIAEPSEVVASPVVPGVVPPLPLPPVPFPIPLPIDPEDDFGGEEDDRGGEGEGGQDRDEDDGESGTECRRDSDCDDKNACTDDSCEEGECEHSNHTKHCDDGKDCTFNDRCHEGECEGTPHSSDENSEEECNNGLDDDCNGETDCADSGCDEKPCDDSDPCRTGATCDDGKCRGGHSVVDSDDDDEFCTALTPCTYIICTDEFDCETPVELTNGTACMLDCSRFPDDCRHKMPTDGTCEDGFCVSEDSKKRESLE